MPIPPPFETTAETVTGGSSGSAAAGHAREAAEVLRTSSEIVWINVGGGFFATTEATLRGAAVFRDVGAYSDLFVDRDPVLFAIVLHWLRGQRFLTPPNVATLEALRLEAAFYGVPSLRAEVERLLAGPSLGSQSRSRKQQHHHQQSVQTPRRD